MKKRKKNKELKEKIIELEKLLKEKKQENSRLKNDLDVQLFAKKNKDKKQRSIVDDIVRKLEREQAERRKLEQIHKEEKIELNNTIKEEKAKNVELNNSIDILKAKSSNFELKQKRFESENKKMTENYIKLFVEHSFFKAEKKKEKEDLTKEKSKIEERKGPNGDVIDALFSLLPELIPTLKPEKRGVLIPLITLLLKLDHPGKNRLQFFTLLKNPTQEQREMIVNNLLSLYSLGSLTSSYFNSKVFPKIKKSIDSTIKERKLLACEVISKFYPIIKKEEERKEDQEEKKKKNLCEQFFKVLNKFCYDFNESVRLSAIKTIDSLIKNDLLSVQEDFETVIDLFLKFLGEEENENVNAFLFNDFTYTVLDWIVKIEENDPQLKLGSKKEFPVEMLSNLVINAIEKNISKKISSYCVAFGSILEYFKKLIKDIEEEIENKEKRSSHFTWLLNKGIPKIINLIITKDSIIPTSEVALVRILAKFNYTFGEKFHEKILKRGFLLILENEKSPRILTIRTRLYPFFIVSICNFEERIHFVEKLVVSIVTKKKNYDVILLKSIFGKVFTILDDEGICLKDRENTKIPNDFFNLLKTLVIKFQDKEKEKLSYGFTTVLLEAIFPKLIENRALHPDKIITLLTMFFEDLSTSSGLIYSKTLKNLSNCVSIVENESVAEQAFSYFKYFLVFENKDYKPIVKRQKYMLIIQILKSFNFIIKKGKFIYRIIQMTYNFAQNCLIDIIEDENFAKEMTRNICNNYQSIAPFEFDKKEELIRNNIMPNLKYLKNLFGDDNEMKKLTKNTSKSLKKKKGVNLLKGLTPRKRK